MMTLATLFLVYFLYHLNSAESRSCPNSFPCGDLHDLEFPLSNNQPECGLFMVNCSSHPPQIKLNDRGLWYDIQKRLSDNKFFVRDPFIQQNNVLKRNACLAAVYVLLSPADTPSTSFTFSPNFTLFKCSKGSDDDNERIQQHFKSYKNKNCSGFIVYYNSNQTIGSSESDVPSNCTELHVPLRYSHGDSFEPLDIGFTIEWNVSQRCYQCHGRGGQCATNNMNQFLCKKASNSVRIWLIAAAGGTTILLALLILFFIKKKRKLEGTNRMLALSSLHGLDKGEKMNEVSMYTFESIKVATNNFCPTNKLGQGGFGPVYKGQLRSGQKIAVKRLSSSSGQGLEEFRNEISLIAKLQHNNLVRILGHCIQGQEMILVYEYMQNKSLDYFLFESDKRVLLKWPDRMKIIEGVAQGLLYLHKYSRLKVIHRDLKASNVLLDENMNPKISDFGLARVFEAQESEANTNRIVGTHGYMSPEYVKNGVVSMKTDVFSFGVLVLEIVSGKRIRANYDSKRPLLNLIGLAWELWVGGRALELMDKTLDDLIHKNEVMRCLNISLLCVQDSPTDRPFMLDVVSMMKNEFIKLPTPKQPTFFMDPCSQDVDAKMNLAKTCMNGLSLSTMKAR